ncbi:hypothetical protein ACKOUJ_07545 [Legionella pneumophila]|uniref:Uncharacterized protein n=1 Tax=Legionella pneumophila TaxID=446 RepID=A0AAN5TBJ2_LEGPN|nr:hypothetical protein [Legionella pneumophila]HAT3858317.1 hypothetical protein [Legionella pneumophila]HAT3867737.1 hypothetical protein [Legionella pneumophila]HAT3877503.1 hypothetical protein [Legionella pneumophila]HAT3973430.1 hypothetical protein [Legionella pneumophila]HAT3989603.1 hypothetical protein [Legionella pneumophila]
MKMICQLCFQNKKLVRSHVIPESFYKNAYPNADGILVSQNDHSKRLPIGIYDKILCQECENKFSVWDGYGNNFFNVIITSDHSPIQRNGKVIGDRIDEVDYDKLKLFIVSILWRAAVCNNSFFDQISLGPFRDTLRTMILTSDAGSEDDFSIIVRRFHFKNNRVLHPPLKTKIHCDADSINIYKIYFFNAEVIIKVDRRPLTKFRELVLSRGKPLIVGLAELPEIIKLLNQG